MQQQASHIILTDNLDELLSVDMPSHRGVLIIACHEGSLQGMLNDHTCRLEPSDMLLCLPSFLIGHYMRTPDFKSKVLYLPEDILESIIHDCFLSEPLWLEKLRYLQHHPVIHLNEFQRDLLKQYYQMLQVYMRGTQDHYRLQITQALVKAATMEIMSYLDLMVTPTNKVILPQRDAIVQRFLDLLRIPDNNQREVSWYAEQLCISPKYLTARCKERTGKNASEWIAEITIERITRILRNTNKTIKEVAFDMGFQDVSFFCQYVRKHTGLSPMALRSKFSNNQSKN